MFPDNFRVLLFLTRRTLRHVQCVLNFLDNVDEDGGTLVVPKFHTYLPEFCAEFAHLRRPLPWVQFPGEVEGQLLRRAHRVTMRQVRCLFPSFFQPCCTSVPSIPDPRHGYLLATYKRTTLCGIWSLFLIR